MNIVMNRTSYKTSQKPFKETGSTASDQSMPANDSAMSASPSPIIPDAGLAELAIMPGDCCRLDSAFYISRPDSPTVTIEGARGAADPAKLSTKTPMLDRVRALVTIMSLSRDPALVQAWELLITSLQGPLPYASSQQRAIIASYFLVNISVTESGARLIADNPTSSAKGIGQIVKGTWSSVKQKYGLPVPDSVPTTATAESASQQLAVMAALLAGLIPSDIPSDAGWMTDSEQLVNAASDWGLSSSSVTAFLDQAGGAPLRGLPPALIKLNLARWKYGNGSSYVPYWAQRERSKANPTNQLEVFRQMWRLFRWGQACRSFATIGSQAGDSWIDHQLFTASGALRGAYPSRAQLLL